MRGHYRHSSVGFVFAGLALAGLAGLLLVAVVSKLLGRTAEPPSAPLPNPQQRPAVSGLESPRSSPMLSDATATWSVYKDQQLGVALRYPPGWSYVREPDGLSLGPPERPPDLILGQTDATPAIRLRINSDDRYSLPFSERYAGSFDYYRRTTDPSGNYVWSIVTGTERDTGRTFAVASAVKDRRHVTLLAFDVEYERVLLRLYPTIVIE